MKSALILLALCLAASAADLPPIRSRVFYAMNADPVWDFQPEELPQFVEMLKKTGCGAVRIPIRWRVVEPEKGRWDFSAVDRVVDCIPENIEILGTIMSVPQWSNGQDPVKAVGWFDTYAPGEERDWKRAVSTIVKHYRKRIKHWEIWNEENGVDFYRPLPSPAAYAELLKSAYQSAKKADPSCRVVLGGLQMNGILASPWSDVKVTNFLEDLYKAGAKPYFDICNTHPYVTAGEGAGHMMNMTKDTLALMARYGDADKPLWLTEVGCGAASPTDEVAQAQLLQDTFDLAAREPRIERVYWFLLRDLKKDLVGPESTMGIFKLDGTAKPSLEAFSKQSSAGRPPAPKVNISAP